MDLIRIKANRLDVADLVL